MQSFVRGQRAKISQLSASARHLGVQIDLQSVRLPIFDFVCFGLDSNGKLSDDRYMVFFNQQRAPDASAEGRHEIELLYLNDQDAYFIVNLDQLPPTITRLVFTISIDGSGTMSELDAGSLKVFELNPLDLSEELEVLLEYRFTGSHFAKEGALMLAEIYRKDGEWRFWAQGQGFVGDLGALLKFFGGQAIEEQAVAPSAAPPMVSPMVPPAAVQPSPPISAPALSSVPIQAPPIVPAFANSLQQILAQTPAGGVVTLPRGEQAGPIVIEKPLVLDGAGAVVWAQNGPVVIVQSVGVTLRNLEIEVTSPDESVANSNVALWIAPGIGTQLQNVRMRGEVLGVAAAEGEWKLPPSLSLGEMAPRAENTFLIEVETPNACEIKTNISGISLQPAHLQSGRQTVEIRVQNVGPDTFLAGNLEFSTGGVARTVPLSGRTAAGPRAAIDRLLLWQAEGALSP